MQRIYRYTLLVFCNILLVATVAFAQDSAIGQWRSHLPYRLATGIVTDGQNLYTTTAQAFFIYNPMSGDIETFSKVNGMHDIGMSTIGWDASTSTVILAYQNSNIDLYRNHSFTNVPDIKLRSFSGTKTVNHIYADNGLAYLSTGLGIVVLNLSKAEVKETYVFSKSGQTIAIKGFTAAGNYFYAATQKGLYRADRNNPALQAFSSWQAIDSTRDFRGVVTVQGRVFVTGPDSLFVLNGTSLQSVYSSHMNTRHLDAGNSSVYVSVFYDTLGYGLVKGISAATLATTDSFQVGYPLGVAETSSGEIYEADQYGGLTHKVSDTTVERILPNSPFTFSAFGIWARAGELWVAHGSYNDKYVPGSNLSGVSGLINGDWKIYNGFSNGYLNGETDFIDILKNPGDGTVYAGTMNGGLVAIDKDGKIQVMKNGILESAISDPNSYPANALAFDKGGNLWVLNSGAYHELAVKTPGGQWYHYGTPFARKYPHQGIGMITDDDDQVWFFPPEDGGVIVYNDNHTPENGADDAFYQFLPGKGAGNLPSAKVLSLAKDRNDAIWVGTDNGIGIINCASSASAGGCEAELRVVQYDQFAGYLFAGEQVRSIAVDGANRKWIGTTNGVWLVSPDADKIILRFTSDNSPLPSNAIQKISIDPITGDVYFGTDAGLVSYRGTATEGGTSNSSLLTFPNPVPSGYSGTVAIRGLVEDADVRITDIAGQLVYRTKALGGQAVWNGLDYTGHRPQSGVLLIFATNKDGSQTTTGKLIYQH